jgi:hypothetical protein
LRGDPQWHVGVDPSSVETPMYLAYNCMWSKPANIYIVAA